MMQTADSSFKYDAKMLTIRQLNTTLDSLKKINTNFLVRNNKEVTPLISFAKFADTGWAKINQASLKQRDSFAKIIPDSLKVMVYDRAINQISGARNSASIIADDYVVKMRSLRYHEIEWHRKLTLSAACLVLFLIGAPLGSIIRKGGLGMPLVFSIAFFVLFHLFNTFGEKFAKEYITNAFEGMWLSTLIMIPISVFLIYKAMRDSQLFNKEYYYRIFRNTRNLFSSFKKRSLRLRRY